MALLLLLTGCQRAPAPPVTGTGGETGQETQTQPEATAPAQEDDVPRPGESAVKADGLFSLTYSPEGSLNPLTGTDYYNEQLMGLLYEGLFALDGELSPEPVLCESFSTEDGQTYALKIREGVRFHDGSLLDTDDVTYTLNIARRSPKYSARLEDIDSVGVSDDMTVTVRLKRVNYAFPAVLDVPIIKNGSADDSSGRRTRRNPWAPARM